eukprot:403355842
MGTNGNVPIVIQKKSGDPSQSILNECMKDQRKLNKIEIERLLNEPGINLTIKTRFTKETPAHFCCKNGHKDVLARILFLCPDAVKQIDDDGNYLSHSLCYNSVSKFEELKSILVILKENKGVNTTAYNNYQKRGIDIVRSRVKEKNPYDTNVSEIAKLDPYLKEDSLLLGRLQDQKKAQGQLRKIGYQAENDVMNNQGRQQFQNF